MNNLNNSFQDYDDGLQKKRKQYSGLLGLTIGGERVVDIETRAGFVYVRLRDNLSEVVQVFNDKVSPVYDFPVLIERKGNKWYVVGRDDERYSQWGTSAPFLPAHGDQHSFDRDGAGGGDRVNIFPDQFMPLLVYPSGTFGAGNLQIAPYLLKRTADYVYVGNTGTRNLLIYKPTNTTAIMGLVYLDTVSGNPGILINSGTSFAGTITGTAGVSPYIPYPSTSDYEPLYAFRLVSGTTALTWDNLYNTRQLVGGSGGSSSVVTGSTVQSFITGSVPFGNSNGNLTEDNPNLRYSTANKMIEVGNQSTHLRSFATQLGLGLVGDQDITRGQGVLVYGTGSLGSPSPTYNGYRSRGTLATPLPVAYNDALQTWIGAGYDGSSWVNATRVRSYADGTWITGAFTPSRMDFEVTPSGTTTRRTQFQIFGDSVNIISGTYNIGGVPHTHLDSDTDGGWTSNANTWTPRSQAYTNDPAAGSSITLNMADTSGFSINDLVNVSSSAGNEDAFITAIVASTSITVDVLTLNHTTTTPLVKISPAVYISKAFTNDPAAGSSIALNMPATAGFAVGNKVIVHSNAGWEYAVITSISTDVSITVNSLALNHTTVSPSVSVVANYNFVVDTNADLSSVIAVGDKIKITDSTVKYFIVHSITTTRLILFGGSDFSIVSTSALSSPNYSHNKKPYGFNTSPEKWKIVNVFWADFVKTSPVANTYYGGTGLTPTGPIVILPIGAWKVRMHIQFQVTITLVAAANVSVRIGLSTADNAIPTDLNWLSLFLMTLPIVTGGIVRTTVTNIDDLVITTPTKYYTVITSGNTATSIAILSATLPATVEMTSSYL